MRWNPKAEAVSLWDADPCGADVGAVEEGSPAFFAAVDVDRYRRYAPWLPGAVAFDRFSGDRVLEIGCGMGTDLAQFCRGGAAAIGIDLTPRHLHIAERRLAHEGFPRRLARADAECLPFKGGSLDAVYSFGVLHHTPHIAAAVSEIRRVLRQDGLAVVALYHRHGVFYWYWLMSRGLLNGALFRDGYRVMMSRIEPRRRSAAVPLVEVYTRQACRTLFAGFREVRLSVHHFAYSSPVSHLCDLLPEGARRSLERWFRFLGWYILVRARK